MTTLGRSISPAYMAGARVRWNPLGRPAPKLRFEDVVERVLTVVLPAIRAVYQLNLVVRRVFRRGARRRDKPRKENE